MENEKKYFRIGKQDDSKEWVPNWFPISKNLFMRSDSWKQDMLKFNENL